MSKHLHEPEDEFVEEDVDEAVIGTALRRSAAVLVVVGLLGVVGWWLLRPAAPVEQVVAREDIVAPAELDQTDAARPDVSFSELPDLPPFRQTNGARGEKLLPETMGSGVAVFDYDGDGDQDLFFANGTYHAGDPAPLRATQALWANDGTGRFTDVTAAAGLDLTLYAVGVAVGDVDGDGDPDLFLAALGENRMLRNDGGRFTDITAATRLAGDPASWSTSAGFFDYDGDGDLDLFVCNYVAWSRDIDIKLNFTLNGTDRAYGPPKQYGGTHSYLYRNDGDHFTDVSEAAGINVANPATGEPMGKALAVTFVDPDNDGRPDILVACDTVQNFVFRNQGDGTFTEEGALTGMAFDGMGAATGAMGMDAAHFADDSRLAVSIGNFANESTSFYVQQPRDPWQFADMANSQGIGSPSRLKLSFGLFFFDYDLDGRLDLLQANGHLEEEISEVQASQQYRQAAQLFWNTGGAHGAWFAAAPEESMGALATPIVGRAAAYGDLDGDGDLDVVLTQPGDRPLVLRNDQQTGRHWLRVKLEGEGHNREAVGARVLVTVGKRVMERRVMPTRSYLAQVELPVTFGLGDASKVDKLTVVWPDGTTRIYPVPGIDRQLVLHKKDPA